MRPLVPGEGAARSASDLSGSFHSMFSFVGLRCNDFAHIQVHDVVIHISDRWIESASC